jgi:hypothetical protein
MAQVDEHRSVPDVVARGAGPLLVVALLHRYGHYFTRDGAVRLDFRSELLPELLRLGNRKLVDPCKSGKTLGRFPRVVRLSGRLLFLSDAHRGRVERLVAH